MKIKFLPNNFVKQYKLKKKTLLSKKNKPKVILFTAIFLLIVIAYLGKGLLIAATVNGEPIFRISIVTELEKNMGDQVMQTLVTRKLIFQEAKQKNIYITDTEIDKEIENTKKLIEDQGMTLENALEVQGSSMEELKDNIRFRLIVERLIAGDINISDDDIKVDFEKNKQFYGEGAEFDNVKDMIKEQLYQQKLQEIYNEWIATLKESGKINYFVAY